MQQTQGKLPLPFDTDYASTLHHTVAYCPGLHAHSIALLLGLLAGLLMYVFAA
jgi:hypothetical protein